MPEEDKIFDSAMKSAGFFNLAEFYAFCHMWLEEEKGLDILEKKYEEKLKGDQKEIKIEWECTKKFTDYFMIKMKIEFEVLRLKEVEIQQGGQKISTNQGEVKTKIKAFLVKDYDGKFEQDAWRKFLRGIYEKWVIPSRIDQFEEKVFGIADGFLGQAKAWLALEGKR